MDYIAVLVFGIVLGFAIAIFTMSNGKLNKENEAYKEGYADGMANAKKGEND